MVSLPSVCRVFDAKFSIPTYFSHATNRTIAMYDVMYQEPYRLIRRTKVILLPVDGSKDSARAASVAFELAEITGARLIILHVINMGMVQHIARMSETDVDEVLQKYEENGNKLLQSYKAAAAEHKIDADLILTQGLPSERILQVADEQEAEVIVMGCRGATGTRSSAIGSTTERVVRRAKCPVLVVKRPETKKVRRRQTQRQVSKGS
ncbi:MAG: universal stress protein [Candidatus Thorarchaeota archaeon]